MASKWEDTVMKGEQMSEEIQAKTKKWSICNPAFIEDVAGIVSNKQAEITWHARDKEVEEAEKRGVKKVMDWIEHHGGTIDGVRNQWRAFLKDLGIEVKE